MKKAFLITIFCGILIILFFGFGVKFGQAGFIWCFDSADCDTPTCPRSLRCDDIPGYEVSCADDFDDPCPMDSICYNQGYIYGEKCDYQPVAVPACSIDYITANGQTGSTTIEDGESAQICWGSANDDDGSLSASGAWGGGKDPSGCSWTSALSQGTYTYGISCQSTGGDDYDEVVVYVQPPAVCDEPCCDNAGWDNVRRCGRDCANDWNEVWECDYYNPGVCWHHIQDCGDAYWTSNYQCAGSWKQREYIDRGCSGGSCYGPNSIWYNDTYCGEDGWTDNYRCEGDWKQREYISQGCSGSDCYSDSSWENVDDCNSYDECVGTTWRDWYCSAGDCDFTDYADDPRCGYEENLPPNTPTLIAPTNNAWINYNPTFQAQVSDPNGDDVRAYFNVFGYSSGWGNLVGSGGTSSWGPNNVGTCFSNWWRAYAQDDQGAESDWSGSWYARVDKGIPNADINNPSGTIDYTTFTVTLTESDTCSGVAQGDVDIKIKPPGGGWSDWQDYATTTSDFNYTGQNGYSYWFRYQVRDNANNLSDPVNGPQLIIDTGEEPNGNGNGGVLNNPPFVSCNDTEVFIYCVDSKHPILYFIYSDPESDPQSAYQVQVDNNSDYSSPEDNTGWHETSSTAYTTSGNFSWNIIYYWRVKVRDDQGGESAWSSPNCSFTTPLHAYPDPDFSWLPNPGIAEEGVQFFDETEYHNSTGSAWSWAFEDANPDTSTIENPVTTFYTQGTKQVDLLATDSDGYSCSVSKNVSIEASGGAIFPRWKEIKPW